MINEQEYVELGLSCGDICRALERGMNGKNMSDLSQSVCDAIAQLTMWAQTMVLRLDKSLTILSIAELWQRSGKRSSNRVGGMESPDFFMQRMIRKQSPLGSWTSTGSFRSSMCV